MSEKKVSPNKWKVYTAKEIAGITRWFNEGVTDKIIGSRLGRDPRSIELKRIRLGLLHYTAIKRKDHWRSSIINEAFLAISKATNKNDKLVALNRLVDKSIQPKRKK